MVIFSQLAAERTVRLRRMEADCEVQVRESKNPIPKEVAKTYASFSGRAAGATSDFIESGIV